MNMTLTERLTSDWAAGTTSGVLFPAYLEVWSAYSERLFTESQPNADLWVNFVLPLREGDMTYRNTEIIFPEVTEAFVPRTPLGRKLLALRNQAIERGMKLLTEDEVLEEVRRRRGELEDDEADIY